MRFALARPNQIELLLTKWWREKICSMHSARFVRNRFLRINGVGRCTTGRWSLALRSLIPKSSRYIVAASIFFEASAFNKLAKLDPGSIQKLAVEIRSFGELLEGHRWWRQKSTGRAILPSSPSGRWQWYRQLFRPADAGAFFLRERRRRFDRKINRFCGRPLTTPRWNKGFAAILGSPVDRSWTPSFQREFFDPYLVPVVAIDVTEDEWPKAMPILLELGLRMAAVTSPLKKLAHARRQRS